MKKKIAILGSTGSIGKITLSIIKQNKNNFEIKLLSTNKNIKVLMRQARNFNVKNEDTRLQSIDYINGRIDYFNRSIQSVKNNSYKVIDHVKKWAIKIRLSRPIIESDRNPFNRNESSLIRIINDKKMYNAASVLKNTDFVICLNKTIYDYLKGIERKSEFSRITKETNIKLQMNLE